MVVYQIDAMRWSRFGVGGLRRLGLRIEDLPREHIELRGDVGIAGQRERHARVERG